MIYLQFNCHTIMLTLVRSFTRVQIVVGLLLSTLVRVQVRRNRSSVIECSNVSTNCKAARPNTVGFEVLTSRIKRVQDLYQVLKSFIM